MNFVSARLSIAARLMLIGALFLAPIALLIFICVRQSSSEIDFARREIDGTRYLAQIWPTYIATATSGTVSRADIPDRAKFDAEFGSAATSQQFVDAKDVTERLEVGKTFIGDVADKSNLTLDPDLDSFYAMDAATVRIPGIAAAAVALLKAYKEPSNEPSRIVDIAFAVDHLSTSADEASTSLESSMKNNAAGVTAKMLSTKAAALKSATDELLAKGKALLKGDAAAGVPDAVGSVLANVNALWAPTNTEVARLLQARIDNLTSRMLRNLLIVAFFLVSAIGMSWVIARGLTGRLKALLHIMDRLVGESDTSVEVPYLSDTNETGKIASTIAAFKDSLVERARMRDEQKANEARATAEREAAMQKMADEFQAAVGGIVQAAVAGDFTQRVDLDGKTGLVFNIGTAINSLCENVARALDDLIRVLNALAEGNLTERITAQYQGNFAQLKDNANKTAERIGSTIAEIKSSAREVTNASREISTSTTDLSQRTEEQAASLEETSASMEEISATVKKNAENAQMANQSAASTREVAEHGGQVVAKAVEAMARIEESSRKISDIIGVIDEIARQTNLLALNAAVEAARAGEAGRGFAVVASEVRSLAQRSSQAAKDIKDLITNSNGQVKEGVELVNRAGESLTGIVDSIKKVAEIVANIANASAEQAGGIEQVGKALAQMDEVTQQNSALVEENAATAKALEDQASAMDHRIAAFKVDQAHEQADSKPPSRRADAGKGAPREDDQSKAAKPAPAAKPRTNGARPPANPVAQMRTTIATALKQDSEPAWREF